MAAIRPAGWPPSSTRRRSRSHCGCRRRSNDRYRSSATTGGTLLLDGEAVVAEAVADRAGASSRLARSRSPTRRRRPRVTSASAGEEFSECSRAVSVPATAFASTPARLPGATPRRGPGRPSMSARDRRPGSTARVRTRSGPRAWRGRARSDDRRSAVAGGARAMRRRRAAARRGGPQALRRHGFTSGGR